MPMNFFIQIFFIMAVMMVLVVFLMLIHTDKKIEKICKEKEELKLLLDKKEQEILRCQQAIEDCQNQIFNYATYINDENKDNALLNITREYNQQIDKYKEKIEDLENQLQDTKHEYDTMRNCYIRIIAQRSIGWRRGIHR